MPDLYIYNGTLQSLERGATDVTAIPQEASLIEASLWETMVKESVGGEAALMASLGVTDNREVLDARPV